MIIMIYMMMIAPDTVMMYQFFRDIVHDDDGDDDYDIWDGDDKVQMEGIIVITWTVSGEVCMESDSGGGVDSKVVAAVVEVAVVLVGAVAGGVY